MARNLQGLCTCGTHLRMMLRASPPTSVSFRCLDPRLLQQFLLMMLRVWPPTTVSFLLDFSNFNFSSSPFDRQVSHSFFYSLNILHTTIHTQIFFLSVFEGNSEGSELLPGPARARCSHPTVIPRCPDPAPPAFPVRLRISPTALPVSSPSVTAYL